MPTNPVTSVLYVSTDYRHTPIPNPFYLPQTLPTLHSWKDKLHFPRTMDEAFVKRVGGEILRRRGVGIVCMAPLNQVRPVLHVKDP